MLGNGHYALFRRAELKTLVDMHGNEAGRVGELTNDETRIIGGALELTEKTARDAMTPLSETFSIDINAKLGRSLIKLIQGKGHSRLPVYHKHLKNIIGLILVKTIVGIHPEKEVPVKNVSIRKIPRVSETMPLYVLLNEFQKGHSHMAVVVKQSAKETATHDKDVQVDIDDERNPKSKCLKLRRSRLLKKLKLLPKEARAPWGTSKSKKWANGDQHKVLPMDENQLPEPAEGGEAIGIITLEDVIEELLQEEIFDETDYNAVDY